MSRLILSRPTYFDISLAQRVAALILRCEVLMMRQIWLPPRFLFMTSTLIEFLLVQFHPKTILKTFSGRTLIISRVVWVLYLAVMQEFIKAHNLSLWAHMSSSDLSLSSSLFSIQPSMPVALAFRLVQEEEVEPYMVPSSGPWEGAVWYYLAGHLAPPRLLVGTLRVPSGARCGLPWHSGKAANAQPEPRPGHLCCCLSPLTKTQHQPHRASHTKHMPAIKVNFWRRNIHCFTIITEVTISWQSLC